MTAQIGRNDPCWCGSGKKFKRCHWPDEGISDKEREIFGSFGLNPLKHSMNTQMIKDPKVILDLINEQKLKDTRPKPSLKLISNGEVPEQEVRRFLVDICSELVDENWAGRSEMCVYFAVLLRDALKLIGFQAHVHIGKATYTSTKNWKEFTWDHAWIVYDDYLVDGNVDSMVENPFIPIEIQPNPYWGLISMAPDDRKFKSERILNPEFDTVELDETEIIEWKKRLNNLLRKNGLIK